MKTLQWILEIIALCAGAYVVLSAGVLAFGFHQLQDGAIFALLGVTILIPNSAYKRFKIAGVVIAVILSCMFLYNYRTSDWMREFPFWSIWSAILLSRPLAFATALIREKYRKNEKAPDQ